MTGTNPAMTGFGESADFIGCIFGQALRRERSEPRRMNGQNFGSVARHPSRTAPSRSPLRVTDRLTSLVERYHFTMALASFHTLVSTKLS
jgi:hypothetical protein